MNVAGMLRMVAKMLRMVAKMLWMVVKMLLELLLECYECFSAIVKSCMDVEFTQIQIINTMLEININSVVANIWYQAWNPVAK